MIKIIKEILTSKTGYFLLAVHWFLCALAIYQRGGLSGSFHFWYEPILLKFLIIVNLFWLILSESLFTKELSKVFLFTFFSAGFQWFLIGYFIDKIKSNKLK